MPLRTIRKILESAFLIALLTSPISAPAHTFPAKSQPAKDETVGESPRRIELWFNDAVRSEYKALAVIDSSGKRVDNRDVEQSPTDASNIHASLPKLAPGTYTTRYRVVSEDSHIVTGKFEFTVKP